MSTETDRGLFRDRVKKGLAAAGLTQKALEGQAGLKPGTLTRIFGGKKQLDAGILSAIAAGIGASEETLVEGTAWASLVVAAESTVQEEAPSLTEEPVTVDDAQPEAEPTVERPEDDVSPGDAQSGPRAKRPSSLLDYPIRAAVAVAGGAALVGAALFTVLRRR